MGTKTNLTIKWEPKLIYVLRTTQSQMMEVKGKN